MTKAQLLADLAAQSLRVVGTVEEVDTAQNAVGVRRYIVNALEQRGGLVSVRNLRFYVLDEGGAGESAFWSDELNPRNVVRDIAQTYLTAAITAGTFLRGWLTEVRENEKMAVARVFTLAAGVATEKEIVIYKNGTAATTHAALTRI